MFWPRTVSRSKTVAIRCWTLRSSKLPKEGDRIRLANVHVLSSIGLGQGLLKEGIQRASIIDARFGFAPMSWIAGPAVHGFSEEEAESGEKDIPYRRCYCTGWIILDEQC